ncbi:MAG: hypothetical protein U5L95_03980 [Candidatus Saccharibacteria bacterium]|nr:hypothetical protein [Candidatus Saccharibacteria bacterium]
MGTIRNRMRTELKDTRRSFIKIGKKFYPLVGLCARVFGRPDNTLYGVIAAVFSVLIAIWFANISILQSVFSSSALPLLEKVEFPFSMIATIVGHLGGPRIGLIATHLILWAIISAFWLEALKLLNERPQLKPTLAPSILATLCIGAVAIIAVSLVTPVLTRAGVSVFVSDHYSGTVLLLFTLLAEFMLIKRFAVLLTRGDRDYS